MYHFLVATLNDREIDGIILIYFIEPNITKIMFQYIINIFKLIMLLYFFFYTKSLKPGVCFTFTMHLISDQPHLVLSNL